MIEWEPVEMGEPRVTSDPEFPAMVAVYVPLTGGVDNVWEALFNAGPPPGVNNGPGLPFPQAQGSSVVFRCPPADVEKQFEVASRWVVGTNEAYRRNVIPELERRLEAATTEAQDRENAVAEARQRLGLN